MDKKEIDKIKSMQDTLGGYTDTALEQMKMLPYLIFMDISNHGIHITEEEITVTLIPYKGKKGAILRKKYKKTDSERAKTLAQYLLFWVPKGVKKPRVIIKWQTS